MSNKSKFSISKTYLAIKKNLSLKYNSFENSYTLVCINNLIYTENCHIVARFKDFLYYDDDTEFLNKFFPKKEQKKILNKVFNFYSKYCKVFPNYMILPENEFLYRNLRKKQKLIDQFNEIKKEEEENRKHLKLKKNKDNENNYIIFGKKEQDSIDKYSPSFSQSNIIMTDYLNFNSNNDKSRTKILNDINNSKNSITISLNYNNNFDINDMNSSELTLISITNLIKKNPSKTEKNSGNKSSKDKLSFTPQKNKAKIEKFNINEEKITTNLNEDFKKKYISYYQNKKIGGQSNFNSSNKNTNSNINNYNYSTNVSNKTNNKKKEFVTLKKNIINNNIIYVNNNTNNNILISSITKTGKKKDSKNIKSAITKKKLFSTTEKAISHKRPIYNYQNKKTEKNSISINNNININKQKKNIKDMSSITLKHSISPHDTKINSIKIKIIDNLSKIQEVKKNINFKSPSHNVSNSNNISYVTKINKNKKLNENEKINSNLDKKILKNNATIKKITTKEKIKNYKNILRNNKTNHFSYDINKNNIIVNKNTFNNYTEKIFNNKNTANDITRKTEQNNKYISPSNKNYTTSNINNIKTPNKPDIKQNDNYKKAILNTKEVSQTKIQNYIKKILDKNKTKKEFFINKPKLK